jgi:serine/threonine protein kinase
VVHRDVKPSNVLLDQDGRAVLADFGLTRLCGEFRTQSGAITGTPMYMAPEQITDPDVEAPTLDVYSFGALTYRALTGRPPFAATDLGTLANLHLTQQPQSPASLRAGVPKDVCAVVLGMLEKKPKSRPNLREALATLARVDSAAWDRILPDHRTREASHPRGAVASPVRADTQNFTTTGESNVNDLHSGAGTEFEADTDEAPIAVAAVTRAASIGAAATTALAQPVFVPKRQRRMLRRLLVIAASICIGLAIGVVVLMLLK